MKKILIIVPDGSDEMEVAPLVEMPGWTKVVEDIERVDSKIAGWDEKVYLFHGLTIVPDINIHDVNIDDYDAICIPGGWGGTRYFEQAFSDIMKQIIRDAHKKGKIIATMCNGILAVGEAGLLNGKKCTSFTGECCELCKGIKDRIRTYGADFQEKSIVDDKLIISNIGPAVGDEDALHLLEILIGKESVAKIVDMMMYRVVHPEDLKWTFPDGEKWKI